MIQNGQETLRRIKRFLTRHINDNFLSQRPPQRDIHEDKTISVYEEVIVYPLKNLAYHNYYGGLISNSTYELLTEAVYLNNAGIPCQHLTDFNAQENLSKNLPHIAGTFLYGGLLMSHYGHFLTESLGRLWAYELVKDLNPYICFYAPWSIPNYLDENNYVNQILTGFGIPPERLVILNQLSILEKVIVPRQKYDYITRPDSVFLRFCKDFTFRNDCPQGFENADKIYVSRTNLPKTDESEAGVFVYGRVIAESLFEEHLISQGYKIFHPELYNLFQQLTVYNSAQKIIFFSGTAVHSCILVPNLQADVAIIARAKGGEFFHNQLQKYSQSVFYIESIRAQYQFGIPEYSALADIDWYKVTTLLKERGFVNDILNLNRDEYNRLVKSEVQTYIKLLSSDTIYHHKHFIEFMMKLKE